MRGERDYAHQHKCCVYLRRKGRLKEDEGERKEEEGKELKNEKLARDANYPS